MQAPEAAARMTVEAERDEARLVVRVSNATFPRLTSPLGSLPGLSAVTQHSVASEMPSVASETYSESMLWYGRFPASWKTGAVADVARSSVRYWPPALISMRRGFACWATGSVSVRTPSS